MSYSRMQRCNQPTCNCTVRHYRTTMTVGEDEFPAWRCDNCGHKTLVKVQGQKSAGIYATLIERLGRREGTTLEAYSGYITFDELRAVMQHHSTRRFLVSTNGFGMVEMDKQAIRAWLSDDHRVKQAARLQEKVGRKVEANVTIYVNRKESGFTHDVAVFSIHAFTNDERTHYFEFM